MYFDSVLLPWNQEICIALDKYASELSSCLACFAKNNSLIPCVQYISELCFNHQQIWSGSPHSQRKESIYILPWRTWSKSCLLDGKPPNLASQDTLCSCHCNCMSALSHVTACPIVSGHHGHSFAMCRQQSHKVTMCLTCRPTGKTQVIQISGYKFTVVEVKVLMPWSEGWYLIGWFSLKTILIKAKFAWLPGYDGFTLTMTMCIQYSSDLRLFLWPGPRGRESGLCWP
jgi:hypothetical protein